MWFQRNARTWHVPVSIAFAVKSTSLSGSWWILHTCIRKVECKLLPLLVTRHLTPSAAHNVVSS